MRQQIVSAIDLFRALHCGEGEFIFLLTPEALELISSWPGETTGAPWQLVFRHFAADVSAAYLQCSEPALIDQIVITSKTRGSRRELHFSVPDTVRWFICFANDEADGVLAAWINPCLPDSYAALADMAVALSRTSRTAEQARVIAELRELELEQALRLVLAKQLTAMRPDEDIPISGLHRPLGIWGIYQPEDLLKASGNEARCGLVTRDTPWAMNFLINSLVRDGFLTARAALHIWPIKWRRTFPDRHGKMQQIVAQDAAFGRLTVEFVSAGREHLPAYIVFRLQAAMARRKTMWFEGADHASEKTRKARREHPNAPFAYFITLAQAAREFGCSPDRAQFMLETMSILPFSNGLYPGSYVRQLATSARLSRCCSAADSVSVREARKRLFGDDQNAQAMFSGCLSHGLLVEISVGAQQRIPSRHLHAFACLLNGLKIDGQWERIVELWYPRLSLKQPPEPDFSSTLPETFLPPSFGPSRIEDILPQPEPESTDFADRLTGRPMPTDEFAFCNRLEEALAEQALSAEDTLDYLMIDQAQYDFLVRGGFLPLETIGSTPCHWMVDVFRVLCTPSMLNPWSDC